MIAESTYTFVRNLTPDEARALIEQPGVRPRVLESTGTLSTFGDNLLFDFDLPDGRLVEYKAVHESDYYGGHYTNIVWSLYEPAS